MEIIVSGGSGFVGKNLIADQKSKGNAVINITREPKGPDEMSWGQFFTDPAKISYDVFVHLAGKAHDLKAASDAEEYFEINTDLTIKIFDLFLKSNASTFIYISSVKAAADTVKGILTEEAAPDPKTPYGQSKLKAEEYILSQLVPGGKRVFILRPCMIHGPGNKGNLNLLYKFVLKGIPYPLAAYENKRSFLSINNLNFIAGQLIKDPLIPGGIYNMADDVPLSTNQVINIIAGASGTKPLLWKISPAAINSLAKLGDVLHLPLNSERLKKLTESYVVSNEKIKDALNVKQMPLSSENGLMLTIQSFQSS